MRIAMLGHKRIPSHEGGIEVVVEELAARMVEKGHQVTCFNRTGQHVSGKEYEVQKLDEYRGIRIRRVPLHPAFLPALRRRSALTMSCMSTPKARPLSAGCPGCSASGSS
mgnify:CR=1 FL=1